MEDNSSVGISNIIRENTEELQDYLRDLERWENQIKEKDENLTKGLIQGRKEDLPPIRNASLLKSKTFISEVNEKDSGSNETDESESDLSEDDEEVEIERKKQKAIIEKDKGNEFFKKGKYNEAITCYTRGIFDDPGNAMLPANRAMALLKLGQYAAAEKDCTTSISIDHTYFKAFHRRATCRLSLKKYVLARQDFLKVLEMCPSNKTVREELELLNEQFKRCDAPIIIEENQETFFTSKPALGKVNSSVSSDLTIHDSSRIFPVKIDVQKPLKELKVVDVPKADYTRLTVKSVPINQVDISKNNTSSLMKEAIKSKEVVQHPEPVPDIPSVPANSFQFERDWRTLRHWPEAQYQYLLNFPPENLPVLFKNSMETDILIGIVKSLNKNYTANAEIHKKYLLNLSKVGRFSTVIMFLSNEEQKEISNLVNAVGQLCGSNEKTSLKNLYNV